MIDRKIIKDMVKQLKINDANIKDLQGFGFESASVEDYINRGGSKQIPIKQLALEIRREFMKGGV